MNDTPLHQIPGTTDERPNGSMTHPMPQILDEFADCAPAIWRCIYVMLGRHHPDAEDVFQEVQVRAVLRRSTSDETLCGWLKRITHNLIVDRYRRRSNHTRVAQEYQRVMEKQLLDGVTDETYELPELTRAIYDCIRRVLSPREQSVEQMSLDGLTSQQIAETLEMPIAGVYEARHRAKPKLRECLSAKGYGK